jgi:hypothetical protein
LPTTVSALLIRCLASAINSGRRALIESIFPSSPTLTALNWRAVMPKRGRNSRLRSLSGLPARRAAKRLRLARLSQHFGIESVWLHQCHRKREYSSKRLHFILESASIIRK